MHLRDLAGLWVLVVRDRVAVGDVERAPLLVPHQSSNHSLLALVPPHVVLQNGEENERVHPNVDIAARLQKNPRHLGSVGSEEGLDLVHGGGGAWFCGVGGAFCGCRVELAKSRQNRTPGFRFIYSVEHSEIEPTAGSFAFGSVISDLTVSSLPREKEHKHGKAGQLSIRPAPPAPLPSAPSSSSPSLTHRNIKSFLENKQSPSKHPNLA